MDADRIYRLSVAGWGLILFWAIHMWAFGEDPLALVSSGAQSAAIARVLVGLAGGPVIGFLVSALVDGVKELRYPDVRIPDQRFDDFKKDLKHLSASKLRGEIEMLKKSSEIADRKPRRENKRLLALHVNLVIHTRASESFLAFTTRRWTLFRMYANGIGAFILALVVALFTSELVCNLCRGVHYHIEYDERILIEVLLGSFVVIGSIRMRKLHKEINEIVCLWFRTEAEDHGRCDGGANR